MKILTVAVVLLGLVSMATRATAFGPGDSSSGGFTERPEAGTGTADQPAARGSNFMRKNYNQGVICAADIPPDNSVVIATGTAPQCAGACTARLYDVVRGTNMVICSGQPIPEGYTLEGMTTNPRCECLGSADNAYLIRKVKPETSYDR